MFSESCQHKFRRTIILLVIAGLQSACTCRAQEKSGSITATGCFLRLKDEAQVPALEQGLLKEIKVELGDVVKERDVLAILDDEEARLTLQIAEVDLTISSKRSEESLTVEIAEAAIEESAKMLQQAKIDLEVARKSAESDIAVRQAEAATTLAQDEYDRAVASKKAFDSSVTELEMAHRRYELEKGRLEIESAKHEQGLNVLRGNSRAAFVEQQLVAARGLNFSLGEARTERDVSSLTVDRMKKTVELARDKLARRQIRSPLSGIVVEKLRHKGEWVEVGEPVLRVIRMDTLFVEGYVQAGLLNQKSKGREVIVTGYAGSQKVTVKGHIVFVSPEADSVNRQVQVKAEIRNPDLALLPGEAVEMVIPN